MRETVVAELVEYLQNITLACSPSLVAKDGAFDLVAFVVSGRELFPKGHCRFHRKDSRNVGTLSDLGLVHSHNFHKTDRDCSPSSASQHKYDYATNLC